MPVIVKPTLPDSASRAVQSDARRSRLVLTVLFAFATIAAFIALALWQANNEVAARRKDIAGDVITSIESIVDRVAIEHDRLTPLVGLSCDEARPRLENTDAFIPYIRSSGLVLNGAIYCVSSYGPRDVPLARYLKQVPRDGPSYLLVPGTLAQPGRPALLVFFPSPAPGDSGNTTGVYMDGARASGVLFYIDGAYLTDVLRDDSRFGMSDIALRNGHTSLTLHGVVENDAREAPTLASTRFPFDVVVHESPDYVREVARRQLSVFVPLGIVFAGMIAWLMSNTLDPKRVLLRAVRVGIERREFEVHYQPVIDLGTGQCVGFEALVRWSHPRWGAVSPVDFIGIVEREPLIVPMTHMIVERALDELHAHRIPKDLHLAVNLAPRHLQNRTAVASLARLLASRARGRSVIAEVTERQLFDNPEDALLSFDALRQQDVRFALDDFGTDRNTLGQLQDFHFDFLKIDQRFVAELDQGRSDLVRGIVALARQMGLTLIAEGIETPRQHQCLLDLGVEYGQGFLHASPMDAAHLSRWLARNALSENALAHGADTEPSSRP